MSYPFAVTLPHVLAIPSSHAPALRRGCGVEGQARWRMRKRQTDQRIWKVEGTLVSDLVPYGAKDPSSSATGVLASVIDNFRSTDL